LTKNDININIQINHSINITDTNFA
jgi:hypothetical protein